jgi:N-acyl amino acid synthase of PEP-CTERM/exosortase system
MIEQTIDTLKMRPFITSVSSSLGKGISNVSSINKIGQLWRSYLKSREASAICQHFSSFFAFEVAKNNELKNAVYGLRHQVYCEELEYEDLRENRMETDEFDAYSDYCLVKHFASDCYAGTVRIVNPQDASQALPIQKYCSDTIKEGQFHPDNFDSNEICEISRLAVPEVFRRRKIDKFAGAATGNINRHTYSETELRCFPFIAIGLYFSAASLALQLGKKHAYVMMEPRLARNMRLVGIDFVQIGPVVNYHGRRAPYYINADLLYKNLNSGFKYMLNHIMDNVRQDLSA